MKNIKGFSPVLLFISIVIVVVVTGIMYLNIQSNKELIQQGTQSNQTSIQRSDDLDVVSADLDNIDVNSLDTELNQLDSEATASMF